MIRYAEDALVSRDRNQRSLDALLSIQRRCPDLVSDRQVSFARGCVDSFADKSDFSVGGIYHGRGVNGLNNTELSHAIADAFKRKADARISRMCARIRGKAA